MDILDLLLVLEKCFQLFTIEYDVGFGFVIYGLYYIDTCYLYTRFLRVKKILISAFIGSLLQHVGFL